MTLTGQAEYCLTVLKILRLGSTASSAIFAPPLNSLVAFRVSPAFTYALFRTCVVLRCLVKLYQPKEALLNRRLGFVIIAVWELLFIRCSDFPS